MVQGPQLENANPSSLLWCREDNLFKRNFQFAKESAKKNKKDLGLDFNPGPSAPRADGTRDANPNEIGPFYNLEGLITYITVQGATVDHSADDADSEDAPAPPKQKQKKSKASKPSAAPKASRAKPLATAPPEPSVQSEDLSRVSKKKEKPKKKPMKISGHELTPAAVLRNEDETIDLSSDEDFGDDALELLIKSKQEAEIFNDLPLFDVDILNNFIDEWFENPSINLDDLELPIGISVSFHSAIATELALAQKIVELKNKIDYEKAQFKKNMAKLSVADVQSFKQTLHELKEQFHQKC